MQRTLNVALAVLLACSLCSEAKDSPLTIRPQETWGDVFGGTETVFHIGVTALEPVKATVSWQFASEGRTIARGEQAIEASPARPAVVEIKLAVPPVKDGVIMPASLTVAVTAPGSEKAAADLVKPLWVFPESPFSGKTEWLKKLNIVLFDPAGKTAALFTKCAIPFKETRNADALADSKDSTVIVGEGVSLREYRGLATMMVKAAAAGIPVLCLAPADGEMRLPGSAGSDQPFPSAIGLKQSGVIAELDKRLDNEGWAPDGKMVAARMALQGDRAGVSAAVAKDDSGWVWVDMQFGKGRVLICGFAVISKWNDSPAPRFLLEKVLDRLEKER